MRVQKVLIGLVAVAALGACATTSGRRVSSDDLQKIQKGQSTYGEVVDLLGEPQTKKTTGEGEVLVYAYSKAKTDATSYLPLVGSLLGKTNTENQVVYIFLDQGQVVREIQVEEGNSESRNSM